jgi:hypothetical protein
VLASHPTDCGAVVTLYGFEPPDVSVVMSSTPPVMSEMVSAERLACDVGDSRPTAT